jgi:pyridinium-3,5-bisthiocarboxylic acid mononucleotide nickel chelatase
MTLPPGYETDEVVKLEANLDDLSPEITGATLEKLLAAGALDVWLTPIGMKKNRQGTMLSVLCEEETLARVAELVFTETSTFGVRVEKVTRLKLERRFETVETEFGAVTVKLGLRAGQVVQRAPEFASCRAASEARGVPLRAVYEAAIRAVHSLSPSA